MDIDLLKKILNDFKNNNISETEVLNKLAIFPILKSKNFNLDTHRELRCGIPEAIYAPKKTIENLIEITTQILKNKMPLLITKLSENQFKKLTKKFPQLYSYKNSESNILYTKPKLKYSKNIVKPLIVTAGTSDLHIAMESFITLKVSGYDPDIISDIGIAGLHRLIEKINLLRTADVIIVAAGMDGALPGVISGLVSVPVIGVPVSNGYGTGTNGKAALLTMLNSCAAKLSVCNIDNGYGAGTIAVSILNLILKKTKNEK